LTAAENMLQFWPISYSFQLYFDSKYPVFWWWFYFYH